MNIVPIVRRSLSIVAILLFLILFTLVASAGSNRPPDWTAKVDHRLLVEAKVPAAIEFVVRFEGTADLSAVERQPTKEAKGQYVYDELRQMALADQTAVRRILDERGVDYRAFWINNTIWVRGNSELIQQLAERPEVAAIHANPAVLFDKPIKARAASAPDVAADTYMWSLEMVNAPAVWGMGYEGQGIVVAGQDTGYDWTHPALQPHYRGWDGQVANHNYNWHDAIHNENPNSSPGNSCGYDLTEPCDDGYHGTHTMGTMVGDDGAGKRVGVAPSAQWIGCRNMEDGWGTPATYTECFEWFIAPYPLGGDSFTDGDPSKAPDVINNSWSCTPAEGCSPDVLQSVVDAVRSAGIVIVQSAGNSGPDCSSVNTPAAIYDSTFTVGAIADNGVIAGFSSRGPTAGGLLKPDIVAPGVDIISSFPGNDYGMLSGTSMASPHVVGMIALLLSARPSLAGNVDAIESMVAQSAAGILTNQGCGTDTADAIPNNVYGWGMIDAAAAVESLPPFSYHIYTPFGAATLP